MNGERARQATTTRRASVACAKVLRQDEAWCAGGTEGNREEELGEPRERMVGISVMKEHVSRGIPSAARSLQSL